jgi:hypothetical protein
MRAPDPGVLLEVFVKKEDVVFAGEPIYRMTQNLTRLEMAQLSSLLLQGVNQRFKIVAKFPIATQASRIVLKRGSQKEMDAISEPLFAGEGSSAVLSLPLGKTWISQDYRCLFVREFYDRFIIEKLNRFERNHKTKGLELIMGTPGIGKSSFALYAAWYALQMQKTVIYKHYMTPYTYFILVPGESDVRVIKYSDDDLPPETDDYKSVYIVDGIRPAKVKAFTVFVSEPNYDRTFEWLKQPGAHQHFFPPWTLDELCSLVDSCFETKLPHSEIANRFNIVGGIPRLVVDEDKWKDHVSHLIGGVPRALEQLKAKQLNPAHFYITSHRVLHLFVDRATFKITHIDFASPYVKNMLLRDLSARAKESILRFMDATKDLPS